MEKCCTDVHRPVESLWTSYAVGSPSGAAESTSASTTASSISPGPSPSAGSLLLGLDDLLDGRGARRSLLGGGRLGGALALGLLGLELGELLLGRGLLALGRDDELQVRPSRR